MTNHSANISRSMIILQVIKTLSWGF